MHNHDEDSKACLNRQILSGSVKKKSNEEHVSKTTQTDSQRTTKPGLGNSQV
jgi:hypothetical protein